MGSKLKTASFDGNTRLRITCPLVGRLAFNVLGVNGLHNMRAKSLPFWEGPEDSLEFVIQGLEFVVQACKRRM